MFYKQEISVHCSRDPELTIFVLTGTSMWIAEPELRTVGTRREETSRDEQGLSGQGDATGIRCSDARIVTIIRRRRPAQVILTVSRPASTGQVIKNIT